MTICTAEDDDDGPDRGGGARGYDLAQALSGVLD